MNHYKVTLPELALVGSTRGLLGAGIGLLIADKLNASQRKAVGWTLLGIGLATTIPIAAEILGHKIEHEASPQKRLAESFTPTI